MARILCVDDDPSLLMTLEAMFEAAGHTVLATEDPFHALELASTESFDAMTIDAKMPKMSGLELMAMLRRLPATGIVPILMLTSLSEVDDRIRGLRSGADDYLVKPFDESELMARIEGLMSRKLAIEEKARAEVSSTNAGMVPGLETAIAELEERSTQNQSPAGIRLGRYEIIELLGKGGMARVYRGWDPKLQRPVALKTIRLDASADRIARLTHRLQLEAVYVAQIRGNPNVVTVYDFGEEKNSVFFCMELVEGITLEQRIHTLPALTPDEVIPLAASMANALAAAHKYGLLHRDIKPANVLLSWEGAIKVSDFGIAAEISTSSVGEEAISGTLGYVPPECLEGEKGTERSDLFSLGAVLYECLTGNRPFSGRAWGQLILNTMRETPTPVQELSPDVPAEVARMVDRLLAKRPVDRPQKAAEVAEFFTRLAAERQLRWTLGALEETAST